VDCAGTLTDLGSAIPERAFEAAFYHGIGVRPTPEQIRAPMGREKREHIRCLLATVGIRKPSEALVEHLYSRLEEKLLQLVADPTEIPGVRGAVLRYRQSGRGVVLTTGYGARVAGRIVGEIDWIRECLSGFVSSSEVVKKRPAPDMIHRAMRILGVVDRSEIVKVDDSGVGVEAADNAGVASVLVLSGTLRSEEEAAAVNRRLGRRRLVARDLAEVIDWIVRGELRERILRLNAPEERLAGAPTG
jgi:phosphonoacetaldehyde hydrolase